MQWGRRATGAVRRATFGSSRTLFSLLLLSALCALCMPLFVDPVDRGAPTAVNGVIAYPPGTPFTAPVELKGDWRFIWRSPAIANPPATMRVPGAWTGTKTSDGRIIPRQGYASYGVRLTGLPPGRYTLHVPIIFAANRVSVNGRVESQHGELGSTPATTRYDLRSHDIAIGTNGEPIDIRIDISSQLHRDNGFEASPVFGTAREMRAFAALRWSQDYLFHTVLLVLFAYGFIVFIFRPTDRASLYFALACLAFLADADVFSYDNIVLLTFPGFSFPQMLAFQYISGVFFSVFFLSYTCELFPQDYSRKLFRLFLAAFALILAVEVYAFARGDTLFASDISPVRMFVTVLALFYILAIVIVAVVRRRDGAAVFLIGIGFFIAAILGITLVAYGLLPQDRAIGVGFGSVGILTLLFSHIIILADRWALAISNAEATNSDLRQLLEVNSSIASEMQLESLLGKIVEVASRIVHAERSSLFLHDPQKRELWSLVAQGDGVGEIRISADRGIAGAAFTEGETINVADAYADPRFNQAVDAETGFRTRAILAMPILARDGRKLGVMQALNREGGGAFTDSDAARMAAFVAQAAISIDNATLFSEVVSSRNYNESILRSMSSGVVTFDPQVRIAKYNAAARRILRMPEEAEIYGDARWSLQMKNPWLTAEIAGVSVSGQPKSMLDIGLVASDDSTVWANVAIIPLISEGIEVGILILIEDISEGKRLQGAMRRFMPQKIVDQVLDRDDLLFGTNCRASVLFADIRNFTSMSEKLGARETVDMLNEVFTDLFEAVASTDGILDKYIGDAIMAVYGVPFAGERDARNSVDAGVAMVRMIAEINVRRRTRGLDELRLGVGIATGDVIAGTIGSPKRMDYTVIGDSVNLASRLQDITKTFRAAIIVCAETAAQVETTHALRELDRIRIRGRQQLERIYEVMIPFGEAQGEALTDMLDRYQQGRALLARRDWQEAADAFAAILERHPRDGPSTVMRDRALAALAAPPPPDWDGVW